MSHPTPTRHGNWHVVDGQLVDASTSALQAAAPDQSVPGDGSGNALPPIDQTPTPAARRSNKLKE